MNFQMPILKATHVLVGVAFLAVHLVLMAVMLWLIAQLTSTPFTTAVFMQGLGCFYIASKAYMFIDRQKLIDPANVARVFGRKP